MLTALHQTPCRLDFRERKRKEKTENENKS